MRRRAVRRLWPRCLGNLVATLAHSVHRRPPVVAVAAVAAVAAAATVAVATVAVATAAAVAAAAAAAATEAINTSKSKNQLQ